MKKKTLIISNNYFNLYNFRESLIKKLYEHNSLELHLCAKKDNFFNNFSNLSVKNHHINILERSYSVISNFITLKNIYFLIKKEKFINIFSFTIKPNLFLCILKFFFNFKLIVTISGLGEIFLKKNFKNKLISLIYIKLLSKSDYIFCHNEYDFQFLLSRNNKLKKKIEVINGSGVNLNKFKFSPLKTDNKVIFLLVARIIKEKGIIEYLKASKMIKDLNKFNCQFILIGDIYKKSIFNNIFYKELLLSPVEYLGFKSNIIYYLNNCSCLVLPSYRDGMSKILLEGCAVGRPLIASDVPGCNNIVKNSYNGFLFEPKSSISLFEAMKKFLLLSKEEKIEFSVNSKNYSNNFDEKYVLDRYICTLDTN